MPRFHFKSDVLKMGLALARLVKPESGNGIKGDYCFKFLPNSLVIFSYDKRHFVRASIACEAEIDEQFESDEFYLLPDRTALFDVDLENITATLNAKSLSIKVHGDGKSRQANLKRRSTQSRRPSVPGFPDSEYISVNRKSLESALHQVSCSALVRETKTEEDMRINQVHFYPEHNCIVSSTRYYGSVVQLNEPIGLDISIVSADIPAIRGFLNKIKSDFVQICQNDRNFSVIDPDTESYLSVGKVATNKPKFDVLDRNGFKTCLQLDLKTLSKNLEWASLAIEGTQRLGFQAEQGLVKLFNAKEELAEFPVRFSRGDKLIADFPVKYLHMMVKHLSKDPLFYYDHEQAPNILGITQVDDEDQQIDFMHFLPSMRMR